MKAQKSILMAILLGLIFSLSSNASESEAVSDLKKQFSYQLQHVPWDYVGVDEICCVRLTFRINDQQIVELISVEGENEDLVQYAKVVLDGYKIKTDEALRGKKCSMEVRFKYNV